MMDELDIFGYILEKTSLMYISDFIISDKWIYVIETMIRFSNTDLYPEEDWKRFFDYVRNNENEKIVNILSAKIINKK
ncbi:MAG: hypothetical protein ACK5L6_09620 [Anaerorhabdus sp.]|uniref:hypothetical protein n=1 Tax=Anaerorhabdus sp. TaxID=1872524 RepID=UPI003A85A352